MGDRIFITKEYIMKKIIKLTESDLNNVIKKVIYESTSDQEKYEHLKNSLESIKNNYNEIIQVIKPMNELVMMYNELDDNMFMELFDNEEFPRDMLFDIGGQWSDIEPKIKKIKRFLNDIDPNGDLTN